MLWVSVDGLLLDYFLILTQIDSSQKRDWKIYQSILGAGKLPHAYYCAAYYYYLIKIKNKVLSDFHVTLSILAAGCYHVICLNLECLTSCFV